MTSELKCPFCETELEQGIELLRGGHILGCPKCLRNADDIFWKALIRAKQDLETLKAALIVAKQTLFYCWDVYDIHSAKCTAEDVDRALEQIKHKM